MIELLLPPVEEESRPENVQVAQHNEEIEHKTSQTSQITQTTQTTVPGVNEEEITAQDDAEDTAGKPAIMSIDASRLEILARLNSRSEQIHTEQDSDNALMRTIIENLESLRNA